MNTEKEFKEALARNDYDYLLETICSGGIFDYKDKASLKAVSHLRTQLQQIQNNYNYQYTKSEEVDAFINNTRELLNTIKKNPPTNLDQTQKYLQQARDTFELSRKFLAKFTTDKESLLQVFIDKRYLSKKEQLQESFAQEDQRFNHPLYIYDTDEDGWEIEGSERLETQQEFEERMKKTNENRQFLLNNVKETLSCNDIMNFFYNAEDIVSMRARLSDCYSTLRRYNQELIIQSYKDNKPFYSALLDIMEHDTEQETYLYHGTQCIEDAQSILKTGLGMVKENLSSTTYEEFTPEQLLLYSRGLAGEIGADAIVIIKKPKNVNIVQKIGNTKITFNQSGLGGLGESPNYIIKPEHIVGFVNKRDHKIEYGQAYQTGLESE